MLNGSVYSMKKLLFILNPNAGQRRANRSLPEILRCFIEHGYLCRTYVTGAPGEASQFLAANDEPYDLVVCAGGDGTLNETISGMMASGMRCALGYIPCGTTNDYASSIGLSQDVLVAARDIVEGREQPIDIGTFDGRYFVYTATCGAFARASYATSQAAKNVLGHLAYVLEGMKDLTAIKPIHMRVRTENAMLEDDFLFCSITNSTSVGGILKLDTQLVALNDGRFEVTLVRNPVYPGQLSSILVGLTTQSLPNEMIHFFSARKIHVETDTPVEWTLDGERASETERVSMENLHSAVRIVVPRIANDAPFEIAKEEAEL
uniref:Putative lipid kinase YegS/Rv2252/BmrU family n=1 Tax=uncultured bacterium Ad_125_D08 TaxID=1489285 RepID=A0A0B4N0A9_9BACT|nr:putative lipid kinase YegS/Rv2252/BmrU family [uncultured bacterium Ad_125_D08]